MDDKKNNPPKKKLTKKKPEKSSAKKKLDENPSSDSSQENSFSDLSQEDVEALLAGDIRPSSVQIPMGALSGIFQKFEDPIMHKRNKDIKAMCGQMQEYLENYVLIGYTIDGQPVNITYAKSIKDNDALSTALQRYILEGYNRQFPPGF